MNEPSERMLLQAEIIRLRNRIINAKSLLPDIAEGLTTGHNMARANLAYMYLEDLLDVDKWKTEEQ